MSRAKCIMVQGTMSGAGKSLLCAALCRIFAQDGYKTAPFKSQNMALNSFVTRDGLEMGRAQVVQAQAAGVEPDVRMNPILLKPSSDVGSQVIVNGEVRGDMPAKEYFRRKKSLIHDILRAYDSLADEFDIIVIEGAGSPAEINLKADDIVNMGLAKLVDAPVLLAGDIDRGGVFAQLYGTVALLEPDERARICGLIINKFRGDVEILRPGLAMLEEKTQLPVLGVVPYLRVDIEDEDSLAPRLQSKSAVKPLDAAVLKLPHISNFTDFMPLEQHPLLGVRYVQSVRELGAPDLVILPGTKNTVNDLLWLRQSGLEAAVLKLTAGGTPVLGVCGGYQLLGETLDDSQGTESGHPQTLRGLGLLPTRTVFTAEKRRAQVTATAAAPFTGAALTGYEIHTGRTAVNGAPFCRYADGTPEGCVQNAVFGTYWPDGTPEQLAVPPQIAPETAAACGRLPAGPAGRPAVRWTWAPPTRPWVCTTPEEEKNDTPRIICPPTLSARAWALSRRSWARAGLLFRPKTPPWSSALFTRQRILTTPRTCAHTGAAAGASRPCVPGQWSSPTPTWLAGITKPGLAKLGGQHSGFISRPCCRRCCEGGGLDPGRLRHAQVGRAEYPGAVLAVGNAPRRC